MEGENHALVFEFPEYRDKIHHLKQADASFNAQAQEYHDLDHKIRGLEMNSVPTDDQNFNQMKMRRAQLKDEIYRQISK